MCNKDEKDNQEKQSIDADKEQRRITRLGTVVALSAIVGTLCGFLIKLLVKVINVWPLEGIKYGYIQFVILLLLSIIICVVGETIFFIVCDLNRYNIAKKDYKQFDVASDKGYYQLLNCFSIYGAILIISVYAIFPLAAKYSFGIEKIVMSACAMIYMAFCILALMFIARGRLYRKAKKYWKHIGGRLFALGTVAVLCYVVGGTYVIKESAVVKVHYFSNGYVEIYNESSQSYGDMVVEIYNEKGERIFEEFVSCGQVLYAEERVYVLEKIDGKKVMEGILLDARVFHWKYGFNIDKIGIVDGKYKIEIGIVKGSKQVVLFNEFFVEDGEYIYATETIEKSY